MTEYGMRRMRVGMTLMIIDSFIIRSVTIKIANCSSEFVTLFAFQE